MTGRMEGKVVLISGGASGIGAAHARVFAAEGAKVLIGDIQEAMGKEVADGIGVTNSGGQAAFATLDVTSEASWADAVRKAVSLYGKLTTLINNAGVAILGGLTTETQASWDKTIAVNQQGVWYGMRAAIPEMKKAGGGAIVNISSVYGIIGSPDMAVLSRIEGGCASDDQGGGAGICNPGDTHQFRASRHYPDPDHQDHLLQFWRACGSCSAKHLF